jgi:chromosome segregation ATPase
MSELSFLVSVTTERDSGLIAGKDEQIDAIESEIEQALNGFEISSIGARSDSTYTVTDLTVAALDKVAEREANREYEEHVRAEEPSDAELRKELAKVTAELAEARSKISSLESAATKRMEVQEVGKTRISQRLSSMNHDERVYLQDGRYSTIEFQLGDQYDECIEIGFADYGRTGNSLPELSIRSKQGQIVFAPLGSNTATVALVTRD